MKFAGQPMHSPQYLYGIDFSGAKDAGKKIWIAEGVVKGDSLLIEDCFRVRGSNLLLTYLCGFIGVWGWDHPLI